MPLKVRLILLVALMLLVSLTLGAGLAWWHATRSVETEMQAALTVGGHTIRTVIPHIQADDDPASALGRLVGAFDGDRHLRASLIGVDGTTLARSVLFPPPAHVPAWFRHAVAADTLPSIRAPLPQELGAAAILLETDPENELTEVWTDFGDDLKILALFALITFPAIYWTLTRALTPLERLARGFREVGSTAAPRHIVPDGPPELVRLAAGFNAMVDRLTLFEAKNRQLAEQLSTIQEDERAELARDLHDEIGPYLFAIGVDISALQKSAEARGDTLQVAQAQAIRDGVSHIQHEVKAILGRLRSDSLAEFGLAQAIQNLTLFWQAHRPEVTIVTEIADADAGFGDAFDRVIYRIVQESLSNAMRHGRPRRIDITVNLGPDQDVLVEVSDDGGGLKVAGEQRGFGLRGMAERVTSLGGDLNIRQRAQPTGVQVIARLPAPVRDRESGGQGMAA